MLLNRTGDTSELPSHVECRCTQSHRAFPFPAVRRLTRKLVNRKVFFPCVKNVVYVFNRIFLCTKLGDPEFFVI